MIHVCFGLHDKTGRYAKFTGTAMLSIFDNTKSDVTVHILHDNTLTTDNHDNFVQVAERYNQRVKFYNVEELCADRIAAMVSLVPAVKTARVSVGAFYRLMISQLLPEDIGKCIYLDSDMLVNLDIKELWQIELGDKPLAAVPEKEANYHGYKTFEANRKYLINEGYVKYDDYFNSGVLVMNLKYLRYAKEQIQRGIKFRSEHTQCNCFDQDILNYLFAKDYLKLPVKFDRFVENERLMGTVTESLRSIHHFSGSSLQLNVNDPLNELWLSYFAKTPWFDASAIGRLYESFQNMFSDSKASMIKLTALMSGKTRAFVVSKGDAEAIKKLFAIRDDEELIIADRYIPLQEVFAAMNASRGKRVFFIFVPDFPFGNFEKMGFVYGKDFLNGFELLIGTRVLPLNSYQLVKAM